MPFFPSPLDPQEGSQGMEAVGMEAMGMDLTDGAAPTSLVPFDPPAAQAASTSSVFDPQRAAFDLLAMIGVINQSFQTFQPEGVRETTIRATGSSKCSLPNPPPSGGNIVDVHNRLVIRNGSHDWKSSHTDTGVREEDEAKLKAVCQISGSVVRVNEDKVNQFKILTMIRDVFKKAGIHFTEKTARVGPGNYIKSITIDSA